MSRTVAEVLRAAKARIDSPEKWTTGTMVDSIGCMCALGALHAENYPDVPITYYTETESPWTRVSSACGIKELASAACMHGESIRKNDTHPLASAIYRVNDNDRYSDELKNHAEVMAMFDDAITIAETTGATCGD